jgi:thiol:disulfide interchange protein
MKLFFATLTVVSLACAPFALAEEASPAPPALPVYDEVAIGSEQLATALANATKENRRVLVQWGANWCIWCKRLHELATTDPAIAKELRYEYDVVHLDIGRRDKNLDLAEKYGVDLAKNGVPYLTVLDADGKVVVNQETGSLEAKVEGQKGHDPQLVLAFLKAHEAPHRDAQQVRDDAFARAKQDGKRVFLHFGAPWCGWCRKLEAWLARPEIANALAKDFVEVKIDTERMVGGQALLDRWRRSDQGGIPWFLFLDADGKVLATSDGPQGNIGFPAAPPELAHFRTMLEKSCVKLTRDDIAALVQSLVAGP